jgi:hypothetical protein
MKSLTLEEQKLYLIGVFCVLYTNLSQGKARLDVNGKPYTDNVFDQMSDNLFAITEEGYNKYIAELAILRNQMIAEARQRSAEADKRSAENIKIAEE